jgi:hypothetical protein
VQAYQQTIQRQALIKQSEREAKLREEWQAEQMRTNAARRKQIERGMDPAADFKSLKEQEVIPEDMTYEEYLQSGFAATRGASSRAFAPTTGTIGGKKVMLTPIFDPVTGQTRMEQTDLPEGFEADSGVEEIDLGDRIELRDKKTGAYLGTRAINLRPQDKPENVAAKSQAAAEGTAAGEAVAAAPAELRSGQQALDVIQKMINHPGRAAATGFSSIGNVMPIPGSDRADFLTLGNQLRGKVFLEAFQMLKGGGQITEIEGLKAEQAMARLNAAQSEGEYLQALEDLQTAISDGMAKLSARTGVTNTDTDGWSIKVK